MFFNLAVFIHFCYHRWVLILFVVVAMICLLEVRQSDKGMRVMRVVCFRCRRRRGELEILGCHQHCPFGRWCPFLARRAGMKMAVWRGGWWMVLPWMKMELHTVRHGILLKDLLQMWIGATRCDKWCRPRAVPGSLESQWTPCEESKFKHQHQGTGQTNSACCVQSAGLQLGPSRKFELKTATDLPYTRNTGVLV